MRADVVIFNKAKEKIVSFYEKSINIYQKRLCCIAIKDLNLLKTSYYMESNYYSSMTDETILKVVEIERTLEKDFNKIPTVEGSYWYAILPESRDIVLVKVTEITDDWFELDGERNLKFEDIEFIRECK
jgi:hypothetical protein